MRIRSFLTTYKVELTGIPSWGLFTFAASSLATVFISWPFAGLVSYNLCALISLLYFFSYYRRAFTMGKFFIFFAGLSTTNIALHFAYNQLLLLQSPDYPFFSAFLICGLNLLLLGSVYFILSHYIRKRK
jgi:hypothetical protein